MASIQSKKLKCGKKPHYIDFALINWIEYYNKNYLHSALGYSPPNKFEETYNMSYKTLLKTA